MADQKFKSKVRLQGGAALPQQSPSKALTIDSNGEIVSSVVSDVELSQLQGVTSPVQTQIDDAVVDIAAAQAAADAAQLAIDNHIADATDAHDASAISNVPAGSIAATDVQAAINELDGDIQSHITDATDAHDASAISVVPTGNLAADDVQEALIELQGDIDGLDTRVDAAEQDIADLVTLSGVAANSTDLGSFTGTIIPDASTIKGALQALETEIEALPNPIFYAGTYDASTNSPDLDQAGTRIQGALYRVTVAGTHDFSAFGGSITFNVGDKAVFNGSVWEKWDVSDEVLSVNGQTGVVSLTTDNIPEAVALYFTDERAQDAIGAMLVNTDTVTFTYTDLTPELKADVNTQMSIVSDISGIKLDGDATTPGNDKYYGTDSAGVKGFHDLPTGGSTNDIQESSMSIVNNQASAANVTGLLFAANVRSFKALISVEIDATLDLFETIELVGVQKGAGFEMAQSAVGDESGVVLSITSVGQVQYTSANYAGFSSGTIRFRAITTSF